MLGTKSGRIAGFDFEKHNLPNVTFFRSIKYDNVDWAANETGIARIVWEADVGRKMLRDATLDDCRATEDCVLTLKPPGGFAGRLAGAILGQRCASVARNCSIIGNQKATTDRRLS